jgi:hypothetical protein
MTSHAGLPVHADIRLLEALRCWKAGWDAYSRQVIAEVSARDVPPGELFEQLLARDAVKTQMLCAVGPLIAELLRGQDQ